MLISLIAGSFIITQHALVNRNPPFVIIAVRERIFLLRVGRMGLSLFWPEDSLLLLSQSAVEVGQKEDDGERKGRGYLTTLGRTGFSWLSSLRPNFIMAWCLDTSVTDRVGC